jgi:hypothetical protein
VPAGHQIAARPGRKQLYLALLIELALRPARMTLAAATEAGTTSTLSDDCHRLEPDMEPQLEKEGSSAVEE